MVQSSGKDARCREMKKNVLVLSAPHVGEGVILWWWGTVVLGVALDVFISDFASHASSLGLNLLSYSFFKTTDAIVERLSWGCCVLLSSYARLFVFTNNQLSCTFTFYFLSWKTKTNKSVGVSIRRLAVCLRGSTCGCSSGTSPSSRCAKDCQRWCR